MWETVESFPRKGQRLLWLLMSRLLFQMRVQFFHKRVRVRAMHGRVKPQIAICLTEVDVGAIMRAKRAGAQGYLLKPFTRPQLLDRFNAFSVAA